ncbi:MAG: four helix bundle protein [Patescibacteria group bacterium]
MRRAVISFTSNIAEGFGRRSSKEKINFYYTAQASLIELQNQIIIARDVGYLCNENFRKIALQSVRSNKLINGLIRSTKEKKFES